MRKILTAALAAATLGGAALATTAPAEAAPGYHGGGYHGGGWGGRSSVFIGSDFGFWPYGYGYDYAPDYYAYPPPVVYAPPPPQAYYAPPAAGYVPQPGAAQAPVAANPAGTQPVDQSYCRQYQGTVVVDGATQPSSGVACKQPNGSWRIVQ